MFTHMRNKRLAVALPVCLVVGGIAGFQYFRRHTYYYMEKPVPFTGLVVNPAGKNLGNPDYAVQDFRRIYAAMTAYRARYRKLPNPDVLTDFSKPLVPGVQLTHDDFNVPDAKYADNYIPTSRNASQYRFSYMSPRRNGVTKPAFPAKGEHDIWFSCGQYTRENYIVYRDATGESDLRGVHVLLWSDGTVEKVPNGQEVWYADTTKSYQMAYRGETGLPDKLITASEMNAIGGDKHTLRINGQLVTKR